MARPERHDVDYFPFIVKRGKTLNILQSKYGLEGIGFFTNLFRFLAQAPDHHYCISEEDDLMNFFAETGLQDEEKGLEMIELMVKTKKLDRELWENHRVIASEAFLESIEDAYSKRKNGIIKISDIREMYQSSPGNPAVCEFPVENEDNNPVVCELPVKNEDNNPQTKVKDRIGDKTRLKGGKTPPETPKNEAKRESNDPDLKKACLSVGLEISDDESLKVSENLKQQSVDSGFIKYAYLKIRGQPKVNKPHSVLKYVCMNPEKYQDYYQDYKDSIKKNNPEFEKARPPGKCPECGGELKATHNAVMCKKCKVLFEYNPESNSWEIEKVLVKSIFD